ncbi:MAG: hypothetical protein ACR2GX_03485 [Candidatus Dormibacteria bacterium]
MSAALLGHAFGRRYDLPLPLSLFVLGGGLVVLVSFFVVLPRSVGENGETPADDVQSLARRRGHGVAMVVSLALLAALLVAGWAGSPEPAENIVTTFFWLVIWIAVPVSVGVLGNWTCSLNPFRTLAMLGDSQRLRQAVLGAQQPTAWPAAWAWWPAVAVFVVVASGELIFNSVATLPAVTATGLAVYAVMSAAAGLVFGAEQWLARGEMLSILFDTWGRLGIFRFGSPGHRGPLGGLNRAFEGSVSRITFVFLLLVSVSFDGLLATPAWKSAQVHLPVPVRPGTALYPLGLLSGLLLLSGGAWVLFGGFARAARSAGRLSLGGLEAVAGLSVSLLPIAFGYLVAHNAEYIAINGQLLIPLLGNPLGAPGVQLLPPPFRDDYAVNPNLIPSGVIWYAQVALIITVHIAAVVLAHRFLRRHAAGARSGRRSEVPWIVVMVGYTMSSLWLLAQPLVQESGNVALRVLSSGQL